mgnify:CR=1 FL=1
MSSASFGTHYTMAQIRKYLSNPQSHSEKWRNITVDPKTKSLFKGTKMIIPMEYINQYLQKMYDNPATGLRSIEKTWLFVKDYLVGISKADVEEFIKNQETTQLHKPRIKAKVNKPIIVYKEGRLHADLLDMSSYAGLNNNVNWLLTVIDAFTRFAYVKPMKNKEANTVAVAMREILDETEAPTKIIQTDNGSEFISQEFKKLLAGRKIIHVLSKPYHPQSNGRIEKFNKTLKTLISRYMTHYNTKHYISVLDDLVLNYNTTIHTATRLSPEFVDKHADADVKREINDEQITQNAKLIEKSEKIPLPDLRIGDSVRLSALTNKDIRKKLTFRKGYNTQWSTEIYKVRKIKTPEHPAQPYIYYLSLDGVNLEQEFFRDQLQKINEETLNVRPDNENAPNNEKVFNREKFLKHTLPHRKILPKQPNSLPPTLLEERKELPKRLIKPNKKYL